MPRFPYAFAVPALMAASLSGGCSSPASPTGVSLSDRIAGMWTLVAQQPSGEEESGPPPGATFALQIVDGRASVMADCNRCNGSAAVGDRTVTLGPALACTRAYCTTSAPFDSVFVRLLAAESAATIQGDMLTLRSDRGVLRFRR